MLRSLRKFRFLFVLVALIVGTLATFVPLKSAYALTYPKPSWWNGDTCDSTHFNASGQTAHLLTTWNGIQVCGYGPTQGGTDVAVTFPGGHGEFEWECTELVKRYLYIVYGAPAIDAFGYNLVGNYTTTYSNLFTSVTNDGTHHIKVGDVLSYDEVVSGDHGHTVIVKSLSLDGNGTGHITVIEQNASSTGQHDQTVTSWVIKHGIDDGGTTDTVSAWLTPKQSWSDISPSVTTHDTLTATSAASTSSVWATGYEQASGSAKQPVTFYYGGLSWTKYSPQSQNINQEHQLLGITSSSSGDAWTVGYYYTGLQYVTLAYHWTGSAWVHVTSDSPGLSSCGCVNYLYSVALDSSGTPWAVGQYYDGSHYLPLLEMWNGTKFAKQTISLPSGETSGGLNSIAFSSSTNGWAVGSASGTSSSYVVYHWDGSNWTSTLGTISNGGLKSVAIVSDSEAWAVGTQSTSNTPLILHYTSGSWTEDTSFNGLYPASGSNTRLQSVSTDGASDVWIAGYWYNGTYYPYTMHFNGYYWVEVDPPSVSGSALLQGVSVVSSDAWAVGYFGSSPSPLAYQYS